jgi:hypothetical protein
MNRGLLLCAALGLVGCEQPGAQPTPEKPVATQAATSASAAPTAAGSDAAPTTTVATTAEPADTGKPTPGSTGALASAPPSPSTSATAVATAEPTESAPEVVGEKKNEVQYSAWLQGGGKYAVGKPGTVQAVLVAKGDYHCNPEYPYKFKLDAAPEGVSYPEPIARGVSIGNERSTLAIPFVASSAGAKTISGTFFFSVCNESQCKIQKQAMSVTVVVAE